MGANKKKYIWVMVVVLIILNVWRWWPTSSKQAEKVVRQGGLFSLEDFELKSTPLDSQAPMLRDIFQAKKTVKENTQVKARPVVDQVLPVKSQEELARESAEAEFGKIRCVGMSVRNERIQAYVTGAGEPALVSIGDKVGSRFVVEQISLDGLVLRDAETGVGGLISISGK